MRRGLRQFAVMGVAVALGAGAVLADSEFVATNGIVIMAPEVEAMDCPAIIDKLGEIDRSQYRGATDIVPEGHPDRPIFDYENALSQRNYDFCITDEVILQDASPAFRHGFKQDLPAVDGTTPSMAEPGPDR